MSKEIVITGANVIDGAGNRAYVADVRIEEGIIKEIGYFSHRAGAQRISAEGMILCPGFIDVHTHSDFTLLVDRQAQSLVRQGVTTEVIGNCGHSIAPVNPKYKKELKGSVFGYHSSVEISWRTFAEYLETLGRRGLGHNVLTLVGHNAVRIAVKGFDNSPPTKNELAEMKGLVEEAMHAGAAGMSTGLAYAPGIYSETSEIVELCKVVSRYDGVYATHVRSYRPEDRLIALHEAIETAKQAKVVLQLSHFPASGNWAETIPIVEEALKSGIDVTCDLHPYTWATSTLTVFLPPELLRLGVAQLRGKLTQLITENIFPSWRIPFANIDWNSIVLENSKRSKNLIGRSFSEIAQILRLTPWEAVIHILLNEDDEDVYNVYARFALYREADIISIMKHETSMIGSDGMALSNTGPLSSYRFHPRSYGTYPKILREFVFERGILGLENAIKKMTFVPAHRFRLSNRGLVMPGYRADLVIFNPKTIRDCATYEEPNRYPEGIEYVIVNGEVVVERGEHTGSLPGKVLRLSIPN